MGLHKTATSSIQKTLFNKDNNALLCSEGLLYPRCWTQNHGNTLGGIFHSKPETFYARKLHRMLSKDEIEQKKRQDLEQLEATLNDELNKYDIDKLLFSGEPVNNLPSKNIEKLRNYFLGLGLNQVKFKVIIYTRNPVTWSTSMIQQCLQDGSPYNQVTDKTVPVLFQDRIGKFIEVFGKEAVHVYSFEEARTHEMGMVGHLLESVNVDQKVISELKQLKTNESISMFTGEFLKYAHDMIPIRIKGKPNKERHKNDHKPLLNVRGDKFDIPLQKKEEIQSVTRDDMVWLNENYGIDYLHENITDNESYENLGASFEDIERIYPALTKKLRDTLVEYMENKLMVEIPFHYKTQCRHLIQRLKEAEKDLIPIDHQEKRLQSKLNISGADRGVIYRELALFMETYGQLEAAETLMNKANLFRPNERFIANKQKEFAQKLS